MLCDESADGMVELEASGRWEVVSVSVLKGGAAEAAGRSPESGLSAGSLGVMVEASGLSQSLKACFPGENVPDTAAGGCTNDVSWELDDSEASTLATPAAAVGIGLGTFCTFCGFCLDG